MKPALAVFHAGIDQLIVFLERTEHEQELIALLNERQGKLPVREAELLNRLIAASTSTKQYIYAVAIVSLYGLLERLVDSLISSFVMHLGDFGGSFQQLPEAIKKNHLPRSLALAEALLKDRFRTETTHAQVIANLHSCLSSGQNYKLNGLAFALHRGNLNLGRIAEMLNDVGAQHHLRRVVRTPTFLRYFQNLEPERDVQRLADDDLTTLFEPIDDLVERRNDVSHGVVQVDEIQSVGLLKDRCAFVRAYGVGLYEMLLQDALKYTAEIGVAQALGRPIKIYNNRIVCFEASCRVAVGDQIFALTADVREPVRCGTIASIEIDRVERTEIMTDAPIKFGVQVGFHANGGYDYFSLPGDRL